MSATDRQNCDRQHIGLGLPYLALAKHGNIQLKVIDLECLVHASFKVS